MSRSVGEYKAKVIRSSASTRPFQNSQPWRKITAAVYVELSERQKQRLVYYDDFQLLFLTPSAASCSIRHDALSWVERSRRMSASGSFSFDFLLLVNAFAIIGFVHTATVVVKILCRAFAEMVWDVDDCRLNCRESHARLLNPHDPRNTTARVTPNPSEPLQPTSQGKTH
jgi:hypothetical protein